MKYLRVIGIIILISLTVLLILIHFLGYYVNGNERYTKSFFSEEGVDYQHVMTNYKDRPVKSIFTGNKNSNQLICFIHGAPGSWNAFKTFQVNNELRQKSQIISVDRFGYGGSDYGHAEKDIEFQSLALIDHLKQFDFDSLILVGHSYGGPIAANMAAINPEKVKSVFMIAPVINPDTEKEFWFNNILKLPLIRFFLPAYVNVSVYEKLTHAESLQRIKAVWSQIKVPVIHWHCSDDWIAPAEGNIDFSKEYINEDILELEVWDGNGHLIPFNNVPKVLSKLNLLLDE